MQERFPARKVYIVDSLGASSGYGLLMDTAATKRDEGLTAEELAAWIEENRLYLHHWFFSTDLSSYVRGGRISKAAAVFGGLLEICPLLNMDNGGHLIPRSKIRTKKKVIKDRDLEGLIGAVPVSGEERYTLDRFVINSGNTITSTAVIRVKKGDEMFERAAASDGPINASFHAIDKIIGKIYPIFGVALILMALALLGVLLFGPSRIPELTTLANAQLDPHSVPIVPTLFITIACGAISGFHATQSPLMARCVRNERECRSVFFGAMISESIIALIWAAVAMAFFGGAHALAEALAANGNSAAWAVNIISNTTLGIAGGILALLGVVAAPITSGDTAFRSARLIVADIFRIEQRTQWKRFAIALPLFVAGYLITRVDFTVVWRYFAWTNQTLATIVLWAVVVWLFAAKRNYFVALLPAVFMTFICASFVFVSGQFFGMENRPAAYALAGDATAVVLCFILLKLRRNG